MHQKLVHKLSSARGSYSRLSFAVTIVHNTGSIAAQSPARSLHILFGCRCWASSNSVRVEEQLEWMIVSARVVGATRAVEWPKLISGYSRRRGDGAAPTLTLLC